MDVLLNSSKRFAKIHTELHICKVMFGDVFEEGQGEDVICTSAPRKRNVYEWRRVNLMA
jgi:hypothetical protein